MYDFVSRSHNLQEWQPIQNQITETKITASDDKRVTFCNGNFLVVSLHGKNINTRYGGSHADKGFFLRETDKVDYRVNIVQVEIKRIGVTGRIAKEKWKYGNETKAFTKTRYYGCQ